MKKREIQFTVTINKDKSETYSGNIINGYKDGIGKLIPWSGREEIGEFKDDKKNGYFEEYFNGVKKFEGYYKENKKHGFCKEYSRHIDTVERNEGNYINGEREGVWKEFVNDKLFKEVNYLNGKKHGKCITYYEENNKDLMGRKREYCEYREDEIYEGFLDFGDYATLDLDYSELNQEEKERVIERAFEAYHVELLDDDEIEELNNIIGTTNLEDEHMEWIIEKFIESNYDEESILYEQVLSFIFDEKNKVFDVERFRKNIEVYEYANGKVFNNTRFDEFKFDFLDRELFENIICNVKDIYFRKNNIIEFINNFIEIEAKNMFESIEVLIKNWLNIQIYISEINNNILNNRNMMYNYCLKVNACEKYWKIVYGSSMMHIDKNLLRYFNIIERKYFFNSKEEAVLTAWLILYYKSVEYLSNVFFSKYKNEYNDIMDLDLHSCINKYLSISHDLDDEVEKIMFTCFLMNKRKIVRNNRLKILNFNIFEAYKKVCELLIKEKEQQELLDFERYVMQSKKEKSKRIDISVIDDMSGYEFEELICSLFKKQGFKTILTKKTNDQGIDIIAEKSNSKIGIQTKRYSKKVGNSAIQEVSTGLSYYNLNKGIVVTNNYFTKSAIELANANGILLWDREKLIEKIDEINFLF